MNLFHSFNVDFSDFVTFYDGDSTLDPLIGEAVYTGYWSQTEVESFSVRSSSHKLHVLFQARSWPSGLGFSSSYWAKECQPFTYGRGHECSHPCSCIQDNTLHCDSTTGRCVCKEGWTSATCSVDINECSDPNTCADLYATCHNVNGTYDCVCRPGLVKSLSGQCQGYQNCTQKQCAHTCGVISEHPRHEKCYCPKGMIPDPTNENSCVECPPWTYGDNCSHTVNCNRNNTAHYDRVTGLCSCYSNWTSPDCSEDVNECQFERSPCSGVGQTCHNTHGSFLCYCRPGFESYNETDCKACGQILSRPAGDFSSSNVFVYNRPVNASECSWTISVREKNIIALSFQRLGQTHEDGRYGSLAVYDGLNSSAPLIGTYSWLLPGLVISSKNSLHIVRYSSSQYSHGYNIIGFKATYISYECPDYHYGPNCNCVCNCVKNNSASCDHHYGFCSCLPGWTGHDCSVDRNECSENEATCPEYSDCKNVQGSYECVCKAGLVMNHQNICISCQNWTYGSDCLRQCSCSFNTTSVCHSVNGSCQCMPGWTGPDCSTDINECDSPEICPLYSTCHNLPGTYTCSCQKKNGYVNKGSQACRLTDCHYQLNNSSGYITSPWYPYLYYNNANCTWTIFAPKGHVISLIIEDFQLESQTWCANDHISIYDGSTINANIIGKYCQPNVPKLIRSRNNEMLIQFRSDAHKSFRGFNISYISHTCDYFTYGETCSIPCECVRNNSQFCDSVNGHCICQTGWHGDRCEVDVNECLNVHLCPHNMECRNDFGSFSCICRSGFQINITTGQCVEYNNCTTKKCSHSCVAHYGQDMCTCPDELELSSDGVTCVVPYYPYGYMFGDDILSSDNKELALHNNTIFVSRPIYLTSGVPFGSSELLQTVAYVMTSGAIILGARGFNNVSSSPNLHLAFSQNLFMIAPYWADINPYAGYTTYHLYENCGYSKSNTNSDGLSPQKENVMKRAAREISEFHGLDGFKPNTVLVVTWVSMEPLKSTSDEITEDKTNTFQAVLVSGWVKEIHQGHESLAEEETSYVIFIYQKGKMNWNISSERIINIGFISDNITQLPTTDSHLVGLIDSVKGNTGYLGVFSFKVGHSRGPTALCNRYICSKQYLLSDPVYTDEKRQLYKCPCTLGRLGNQWQLFERRGANQDIYCYAISAAAKARFLSNNRRNKLCCYKWNKIDGSDWRAWEENKLQAAYIPSESVYSGHVLINDLWSWSHFNNSQAMENVMAHEMCCKHSKMNKCSKFYEIFPDMGCTEFVDFVSAAAVGDPHIITLDGLMYTMNGWGEYILLEIKEENFTLQARTEPVNSDKTKAPRVTVFTAFSAREKNIAQFQVELDESKRRMIIYINGEDFSEEFYKDPDFVIILGNMRLVKEIENNNIAVSATFSCGVSMKVSLAVRNLHIGLQVDKLHQSKTGGLLGNFNGNKMDEFVLPNGIVLPNNMTDFELFHNFAKKWEVTAASSVFEYGLNNSFDDYQHPNFIPMFTYEADTHTLDFATQLCGLENDACIFDYLATMDVSFAESTKKAILRQRMIAEYLDVHKWTRRETTSHNECPVEVNRTGSVVENTSDHPNILTSSSNHSKYQLPIQNIDIYQCSL
ncbi:hypothetical protein Btru_017810 [Bulinus truncatus]|nr:hypothetical protein Btru_017810 [Bulinus truncatus]